jgi:3-oxoacyl-[acyl-carrier-protein] synthase III
MRFSKVSIASLSYLDAPERVPSAELERRLAPATERLGMPHDVLTQLTGIVERRFWPEGTAPSEVAARAGAMALEEAGVARDRVGVLVNTSVCRDYVEPSVASIVHARLGLEPTCLGFDVANACLGFLNGLQIVGNMIERGQVDYGLVVDGEGSRFAVERTIERLLQPGVDTQTFRDNFATLTLGSGAAAVLLARRDLRPYAPRLVGDVTLASPEHNHLCRGQLDHMVTDSAQLLTAGLALARRTFEAAREQLGWAPDRLDEVVMHQVSAVHTDQLSGQLGLDPSRVFAIFPRFGNVGPASIPIVLGKSRDAGRLRPGARVALMGIGSGLSCSMMELVW